MAEPRSVEPRSTHGTHPDLSIPAAPWMYEALCAQTDPESFFPEKGGSTREAKGTCARCDVAAECLDYALANQIRFGIWGGTSERERRDIAKTIGLDFPDEEPTHMESA